MWYPVISMTGYITRLKLFMLRILLSLLLWIPLLLVEEVGAKQALQLATVEIGVIENDQQFDRRIKPRTRGIKPHPKKGERFTQSNRSFTVTGYREGEYVHGEIRFNGGQDISGYIYRLDKDKVYIYGTLYKKKIIAYDLEGNLYQLIY